MQSISLEGLESSLTDDGCIADTVATLVEIVEEQADRIDELEDRLDEEQTQRGKDDAELRGRITDTEERLNDVEDDVSGETTPTPDTETDGSTTPETPLKRVCSLPEEAATSQLSANQRRARFVAKDVEQYASKVPAGYAITSGEISTVLRAGTDCKGRTETVSRVMDFLEELGKDAVKIVERRGTRRVILDEQLVEQLREIDAVEETNHTGCDGQVGLTS
jgi:chemotaxis regulatin CheY-phosphate phosphatase CheZ